MRLAFMSLMVAVSAAGLSHAQPLSERAKMVSGDSFVRAFLGHCAQNVGNIERVNQAAEVFGFADLPKEYEALVAPQGPSTDLRTFIANSGEASPFFLATSHSVMNGKSFAVCAIANPYIETASVVSALKELANLATPNEEEITMGQRYRIWFTDNWAKDSYVFMTDGEPMGYGGSTLVLIAPSIK